MLFKSSTILEFKALVYVATVLTSNNKIFDCAAWMVKQLVQLLSFKDPRGGTFSPEKIHRQIYQRFLIHSTNSPIITLLIFQLLLKKHLKIFL
jgi:hypothetical protein